MYLSRLIAALLLSGTFCLIGWSTLIWSTHAQTPAACQPQPYLSNDDGPSYLLGQPLIYTLTNTANCTDTFLIEATTLSKSLLIEYWEPTTAGVGFNQDVLISIHMPVMADAGTITDTLLITATSQMSENITAVLVDPVVLVGGELPSLHLVYLPLVVKRP